jgi:hypothetical protein
MSDSGVVRALQMMIGMSASRSAGFWRIWSNEEPDLDEEGFEDRYSLISTGMENCVRKFEGYWAEDVPVLRFP